MTNPFGRVLIGLAAGLAALGGAQAQAESIKIGLSKLLSYPAVPIAIERGYFKAEGIDAQLVFFDSAQPIAVGGRLGRRRFRRLGPVGGILYPRGARPASHDRLVGRRGSRVFITSCFSARTRLTTPD